MRLQTVGLGQRDLGGYRGIVAEEMLGELESAAAPLRGLRVLHLSATPYGGGVSELLRSMVPLLRSLGIAAEWKVISGDAEFFTVTKAMHNALQGDEHGLTLAQRAAYERTSRRNAAALERGWDVVVAHDPQPAALRLLRDAGDERWVWRCHIDTSTPNPGVWSFLRPFLDPYDAAVFTMREFVPPDLPVQRVAIIPPAIDPLSPKNLRLPDLTARQVLSWIGIDLTKPLVTQVSRFDPWKDPFGVLEAYRRARREVPTLQLAMVGAMALDDPQGWDLYERLGAESLGDPLIHLHTNLTGVGNIEVNAFQRLSDVIVQKSLREGFGLVVSEAMWKGTPVVAGRAGGIPMQVGDDGGGVLVDDTAQAAAALVELVQDPARAERVGARGRRRVRSRFLMPRLIGDELTLLASLAGDAAPEPAGSAADVAP